MTASALRLRLPATSANLGPGFDTSALALALHLEIDAWAAEGYSINATGRDCDVCERLEGNLLLETYRRTVAEYGRGPAVPLALTMRNGIPLGMGCGSSAASRLAGLALAAHFGELGWERDRVLEEACKLEGHPDNAAACWLGGYVASAMDGSVPRAVSFPPPAGWCAMLAFPRDPLATTASRAVLPERYGRSEVVGNLQAVSLLTAAWAAGRGDLLRVATRDALHQPYRGAVCPLLPALLPLAGAEGILSVTLSGAGPAVLLLLESKQAAEPARALVEQAADGLLAEALLCELEPNAAGVEVVALERA